MRTLIALSFLACVGCGGSPAGPSAVQAPPVAQIAGPIPIDPVPSVVPEPLTGPWFTGSILYLPGETPHLRATVHNATDQTQRIGLGLYTNRSNGIPDLGGYQDFADVPAGGDTVLTIETYAYCNVTAYLAATSAFDPHVPPTPAIATLTNGPAVGWIPACR